MAGFSRRHRLTTQHEFRHVWNCPRKIRSVHGLVFFRQNENSLGRVGIIIKKQSVSLARQRNLIRRIVRESFRSQIKRLEGLDIIILPHSVCAKLDKKTLRDGIDQLWDLVLVNHSNAA